MDKEKEIYHFMNKNNKIEYLRINCNLEIFKYINKIKDFFKD
jgi:hypothetical protein